MIDLNMNVNETNYASGYNNRIYVGLKVGGVDQGYISDYWQEHPYGSSYEVYGVKIDGTTLAVGKTTGTIGAGTVDLRLNFNTINFVSNNSNYGTVSYSGNGNVIVLKGTTYSSSGATITLSDTRTVTATKTDATGYTTTFRNWSSASGP